MANASGKRETAIVDWHQAPAQRQGFVQSPKGGSSKDWSWKDFGDSRKR